MTLQRTPASKRNAKTVIGRKRFAKICAVEGIKLSAAMSEQTAQFDRQKLSASQRRREIIKAHKKG